MLVLASNPHPSDRGNSFPVARFPLSSLVILIGCLPLYSATFGIRDLKLDVLGPAFMPRFAIIGLMVLTAADLFWFIWTSRRNTGVNSNEITPEFESVLRPRSLGVLVLLALYIGAMSSRVVNFEVLTVSFIAACGFIVGLRNWRAVSILAVAALLYTALLSYVFRNLLFVPLP